MARALFHRRRLVLLGAPIAVVLALLLTHRLSLSPPGLAHSTAPTGQAVAAAFVDTPSSQAADLSPSGGDGVQTRANLLAALVSSDSRRADVARRAGLRPDQLDVSSFTYGPAVATALAQRVQLLDGAADRAYVVRLTVDDEQPIVRVDTSAPDAAQARRLAQATVDELGHIAAPAGTAGASGYAVRPLGAPVAASVGGGSSPIMAVAVAVAALLFWLLAVVFAAGARRAWRRAGAVAAHVCGLRPYGASVVARFALRRSAPRAYVCGDWASGRRRAPVDPRSPGDRVKTDRRDAKRLVRIDRRSAAGVSADLGSFERFAKPALLSLLSGLLGIVPSEYTSEWLGVVGGESGAIGRASVW